MAPIAVATAASTSAPAPAAMTARHRAAGRPSAAVGAEEHLRPCVVRPPSDGGDREHGVVGEDPVPGLGLQLAALDGGQERHPGAGRRPAEDHRGADERQVEGDVPAAGVRRTRSDPIRPNISHSSRPPVGPAERRARQIRVDRGPERRRRAVVSASRPESEDDRRGRVGEQAVAAGGDGAQSDRRAG